MLELVSHVTVSMFIKFRNHKMFYNFRLGDDFVPHLLVIG